MLLVTCILLCIACVVFLFYAFLGGVALYAYLKKKGYIGGKNYGCKPKEIKK